MTFFSAYKLTLQQLGWAKFIYFNVISSISGVFDAILVISIYPALQSVMKITNGSDLSGLKLYIHNVLTDGSLFVLTIILTILILSVVLKFYTQYLLAKYGHQIGQKLSLDVYKNLHHGPFEVIRGMELSNLTSILGRKSNETVGSVLVPLLTLSSVFVSLSVIFTILIISFGNIVIVSAVCVACFFCILYLVFLPLTKFVGREYANLQNTHMLNISESYQGVREVRLYELSNMYVSKFKLTDWNLRFAQIKIYLVSITPRMLIELAVSMAILIVPLTAIRFDISLVEIIPFAGAASMVALRVLPQISNLYSSFISVQGGLASLEDMVSSSFVVSEVSKAKQNSKYKFSIIKVQNVNYNYKHDDYVFRKNLNFEIKSGEKIKIVGKNGSGKSTLLDLLMGLIKPSIGKIKIEGNECNLDFENLRIGLVPQSVIINKGTIRDNLQLNLSYADEQLKHALLDVGLQRLELDTFVDENGKNFSGGERQRLGIARALLRRPDLLVLDECTAAIDFKTTKEIYELIANLKMAVVLVSHDAEIKNVANKIINLDD